MQLDDMILVSVDDHVCEPPDMWRGRLAAKWKDRAPRLVHKRDGTDVWVFDGQQMPNIGAQRRRRPAARGVRHGADVASSSSAPGATTSTPGWRT